jgi:hypothetical protein
MIGKPRVTGRWGLFVLLAGLVAAGQIAYAQERFWLFREQVAPNSESCSRGVCATRLDGRRFPDTDAWTLRRAFDTLGAQAQYEGRPPDDPEAPRLCSATLAAEALSRIEAQSISPKPDALRGLTAVGLDLSKIKLPPAGEVLLDGDLERQLRASFQAAGLAIVSREAAALLPGQPQLNLSYTMTDPIGQCVYTYTVFASLTQTAVLTRNPLVKVSASVWTFSGKGSVPGNESSLVAEAAISFLSAWEEANPATVATRP